MRNVYADDAKNILTNIKVSSNVKKIFNKRPSDNIKLYFSQLCRKNSLAAKLNLYGRIEGNRINLIKTSIK